MNIDPLIVAPNEVWLTNSVQVDTFVNKFFTGLTPMQPWRIHFGEIGTDESKYKINLNCGPEGCYIWTEPHYTNKKFLAMLYKVQEHQSFIGSPSALASALKMFLPSIVEPLWVRAHNEDNDEDNDDIVQGISEHVPNFKKLGGRKATRRNKKSKVHLKKYSRRNKKVKTLVHRKLQSK